MDDGLGRIRPKNWKMGEAVFMAPKSVNPDWVVPGVATAATAGCCGSGGLKPNSHQLLEDRTESKRTLATMVPTPYRTVRTMMG